MGLSVGPEIDFEFKALGVQFNTIQTSNTYTLNPKIEP